MANSHEDVSVSVDKVFFFFFVLTSCTSSQDMAIRDERGTVYLRIVHQRQLDRARSTDYEFLRGRVSAAKKTNCLAGLLSLF